MSKTFRPVTDTFVDVIAWNRRTGLRDVTPFDGPNAEIGARAFCAGIGQDIMAGKGPYEQVTLELKTVTTWEYR